MNDNAKQKAVLNGVTVTFGVITARVDLVPVQQSKATRAKNNIEAHNLCPTCSDDVRLQQRLYCPEGHGPFTQADARKGISSTDGTAVAVPQENLSAARAATVKAKSADLVVCPAAQVEDATMPNGNLFRLRSEPTKTYGLLRALVDDPTVAFICEMVVKGKTGLYRALAHRGTIVLVELVRPERMLPAESVDVAPDARVVEQGRLLVAAMLEDFVPERWADERQARLEELRETASQEPTELPATSVDATAKHLLALLEAA